MASPLCLLRYAYHYYITAQGIIFQIYLYLNEQLAINHCFDTQTEVSKLQSITNNKKNNEKKNYFLRVIFPESCSVCIKPLSCGIRIYPFLENIVDPDQLASQEQTSQDLYDSLSCI